MHQKLNFASIKSWKPNNWIAFSISHARHDEKKCYVFGINLFSFVAFQWNAWKLVWLIVIPSGSLAFLSHSGSAIIGGGIERYELLSIDWCISFNASIVFHQSSPNRVCFGQIDVWNDVNPFLTTWGTEISFFQKRYPRNGAHFWQETRKGVTLMVPQNETEEIWPY